MDTRRGLAERVAVVLMEGHRPSPATSAQIVATESRLGITLPADMRNFYLSMDGSGEMTDVDHGLVRFWSLAEWKRVQDEVPKTLDIHLHDAIVVADHSIWCWAYAAAFSPATDVVRFFILEGAGGPAPIAETFTDFVELVLRNDRRLYEA